MFHLNRRLLYELTRHWVQPRQSDVTHHSKETHQ